MLNLNPKSLGSPTGRKARGRGTRTPIRTSRRCGSMAPWVAMRTNCLQMPRRPLLGIMIIAASSGVSYADGKIKVLPDTISPNDAYAIAWGDDKAEGIATEVPFDDGKWDEQMAE